MRIHHHVSIILFVAIAGAIGLAVTVGVLLGSLERAARSAGKAAEQYRQVQTVVTGARELQETVESLGPESGEAAFTMLDQDFERAVLDLANLRHSALLDDPLPVEEAMLVLETMARQGRRLAERQAAGILQPEEVQQFRDGISLFMKRLYGVERDAATAAGDRDRALARARKVIMVVIGVICILYLAVIERVRHWTTRRLIHPVQTLANAAIQAMESEKAFRGLEQGSTEELNTLARVLANFVNTLKARVRDRTAEVEKQKEHLEREVAVRRRAEDQLRHAAFHDKLTGLCNRDLLLDRLERCMDRARRNDDRFKEVNDSLGHFMGDQLLVAIAERLQQCLRGTDSLTRVESNTVARIGGDEFVVLLDGIRDRADATVVAERVQDVLSEPFRLQGHEIFTTASIGIAFNELECEKADHLLRDADTAMYYAKAAGKARHEVFNTKMHDEAMSRLKLHTDLKRAVEANEFHVFYQPIISLRTGRLAGFEVLARWDHPDRGAVDPVDFISHAEDTGLIVELGRWVLDQACWQLRAWKDLGLADDRLTMSVNVSKRQVAEPGFVEDVQQILRDHRMDGSRLALEITESVIMENPDSIAEVLGQLKALKVEIHMDDFGTGYSSLSYLHRFPLDVLKIDRAFVSTMSDDTDYADIIHTVVALAHTLSMQVIVEGVETEQQLARLMLLDCDFAQGYHFSEPLGAMGAAEILEATPKWLKPAA
ncbi:MAG: putative bifunctional diguanylate cyclase/phosphodiesterase [Planctomycetota bacterium]|jgi:diguanylate cyclase (GGDEF)-like protein